ncbi:MAG: hypothetical protein ACYC6A_19685 [Armatimonadota bacterium]
MDQERKEQLLDIAIRYACLCDDLEMSLFEALGNVLNVDVEWIQVSAKEWKKEGFHDDQSMSVIINRPYRK